MLRVRVILRTRILSILSLAFVATMWAAVASKTLPLQKAMRTATGTILQMLKENGYTAIGTKSIDVLIKKSAQTQWRYLPVFMSAGKEGERMSGSSQFDGNSVVLGYPFMDAYQEKKAIASEPLNIFAFHESCFVNGIEDTHYATALSVAYETFLKDKIPSTKLALVFHNHLIRVATYKDNPLLAKGLTGGGAHGGTGVNGGGDIAAVDLKYKLVSGWAFKLLDEAQQKFYDIEPTAALKEILKLNVHVSYNDIFFELNKSNEGTFQVIINHNEWFQANPSARLNYQMNVMSILMYALGNPKLGNTDNSETINFETGSFKSLLAANLAKPIFGLGDAEAAEKVKGLKVTVTSGSTYRFTLNQSGTSTATVSRSEWQKQGSYPAKMILLLSCALGRINYETLIQKK